MVSCTTRRAAPSLPIGHGNGDGLGDSAWGRFTATLALNSRHYLWMAGQRYDAISTMRRPLR